MNSNYRHDDASTGARGPHVQKERFAREQYVRVQLNGNRTEIGVVADVNEFDGTITVTTRHGYDVVVRPEAVHRAFLVVLDLNGVLGARNRVGFKPRPHVAEFVKFLFNHFAVAVWTSGLERTSTPVIEAVFDGYQDRLLFTLFRDACISRPTLDNPHGTFKDLQRIFDSYPQSFHSVNTIIIDDSPDKCSHPDIALCPVPFKDAPEQADDTGLIKVMQVLQEVLDTDSIHPLIRAAEERLTLLRAATTGVTSASLSSAPQPTSIHTSASTTNEQEQLHEITLWRTRLCCENLRGCCRFGSECRFSHDVDDGKRPCSHKNTCRFGHASRWVPTASDDVVDRRRRERLRFTDQSDKFFLSKEELATVQQDGRSHTGIPRLDAVNESARTGASTNAHVAHATSLPAPRSGAANKSLNTTFSTNPRTSQTQNARQNDVLAPTHAQRNTGGGAGGVDLNRAFAGSVPQRHVGAQGAVAPPQPRSAQVNQPRGGRNEVHLRANQKDGTALLRQLEMLTRQ